MNKFVRNILLISILIIICSYMLLRILNPVSNDSNEANSNKPVEYTKKENNKIDMQKDSSDLNTQDVKNLPNGEEVLNVLCSDKYITRQVGSNGNKFATAYIADLLKKIGLEPVFGDSYLNEFSTPVHVDENGTVLIEGITKNVSNVVGKIRGKDSKSAIVITAHFDAWGKGVFDNGSGLITSLEIAKNLAEKSQANKLNFDVIFCMTNAEMSGFKGSKAFVPSIKSLYENLYNINIDCVGAKEAGPLALKNISKLPNSTKLYEGIKSILKNHNIEFLDVVSSEKLKIALANNTGVSDYISFEKAKIPNIHIAQSNIKPLLSNIDAKIDILDFQEIYKLADAITQFIEETNF